MKVAFLSRRSHQVRLWIHPLMLLFLFCFFSLEAEEGETSLDPHATLAPYFLPDDHPIKSNLDALFQKERVTASIKSLLRNGFEKPQMRGPTQIIVGRHPDFPGYLFKLFLDTQPPLQEWVLWLMRIQGALAIQACIDRHGFKEFVVPKKWVYPLPIEAQPIKAKSPLSPKQFILVVEQIPLLSAKKNLEAFKRKVSRKTLNHLFIILTEEGLIDSVYPDNIPFTTKGKIAFIDTEHRYPGRAVPYEKLTAYLSRKNQRYWNFLHNNKSLSKPVWVEKE